ncbi:hypothetical protein L0U85_02905 [Glycomyces sp. L485]|uniref:hypothetical protein n=1 Tax=Glycomyces sp. L485 TaxID=2909235 RepID=UPI001F4B97BE|nr:hypothetical protein [Glycomyces sp. L485]MCH7229813.1 hypothetical protein [Glycomyces sp. L485]
MGESTSRRRDTMSDQALIEGTGVDWKTWLAILDEHDATKLDHTAIAHLLVKEFGVDGWWAQSITVGYEQERGVREPGQRPDGTFSASASKTVQVDPATAFEWIADDERLALWLDDLALTQRSAAPPKSVRFDASDGSRVNFYLDEKGPGRTAIQVETTMLPSADEAANAKAAWRERLARLAEALPR